MKRITLNGTKVNFNAVASDKKGRLFSVYTCEYIHLHIHVHLYTRPKAVAAEKRGRGCGFPACAHRVEIKRTESVLTGRHKLATERRALVTVRSA